MIIKVRFIDTAKGDKEHTMLFGDSYKKWEEQFCEYLRRFPSLEAVRAWRCKDKWKGWGGLKWCSEESFQEELNREGVQSNEPDNPNPRQYADMKFWEFDPNDLPQRYDH